MWIMKNVWAGWSECGEEGTDVYESDLAPERNHLEWAALDPWKTWVWIARIRAYVDFLSIVSTTGLCDPGWLNPKM